MRKKGECSLVADFVELIIVCNSAQDLCQLACSSIEVQIFRKNCKIIACRRSTIPLDWGCPVLETMCSISYAFVKAANSELTFSFPLSITIERGMPKYGKNHVRRILTTDSLVLVLHGRTIGQCVYQSTNGYMTFRCFRHV